MYVRKKGKKEDDLILLKPPCVLSLPAEVTKWHEGVRKQLSVVFPRVCIIKNIAKRGEDALD
jgi:hypothetical protein